MAKLFVKGSKFAMEKKWMRQLLMTAAAALLLMLTADFAASIIREMVAYHTVGTYVMSFIGINAFFNRKKLARIGKKLAAMSEEDGKISSPSPAVASGNATFADVAAAFTSAVNGAPAEEEEVFED